MMSHSHYDISITAYYRPHSRRRLRFNFFAVAIALLDVCLPSHSQAKDGGWDLSPYNLQITIAIDAPGGIAEQLAAELPRYVERRVDASLAPLWGSNVNIAAGPERAKILASIDAS